MKIWRLIVALLAMLVLAPSLRAAEGGEIIWWEMSGDSIQLDGTATNFSDLKVRVDGKTLDVNAVRVHYGNADGSDMGYLDIYAFDGDNAYVQLASAVAPAPGAYFSPLTGDYTTYSYVLELGNWSNSQWLTGMNSEAMTYEQLAAGQYIAQWNGITPNYAQPWSPAAYSVPEPSGGLLLVLGGALLMLRRRRKKGVV